MNEPAYVVSFYVTARGECPFEVFLDAAQPKVRAKFARLIELLSYQGPDLKRPYADLLSAGIRELRVRWGHGRYRALYFFIQGRNVVITHGILKNTAAVPPGEIERACRCRDDLEARIERGEVEL